VTNLYFNHRFQWRLSASFLVVLPSNIHILSWFMAFGLDDWIYWHLIHTTCNYTLYSSRLHMDYSSQSSLAVFWQRIYNSLTVTSNHTWSLLWVAHFPSCRYSCNCQFRRLDSIQFLCSQVHIPADWSFESRLTLLSWTLLYNHFVWSTQKTQPLYCWEDKFRVPLHSNGSY
jgi:hypothetical protein